MPDSMHCSLTASWVRVVLSRAERESESESDTATLTFLATVRNKLRKIPVRRLDGNLLCLANSLILQAISI